MSTLLQRVQGNILRAYGNEYTAVRHLVLRVVDPAVARRALSRMIDGDRSTPDVTRGERPPKEAGYRWCLNLGFTFEGLKALELPDRCLDSFPPEFKAGMVARAARLGDVGDSAPEHWVGGLNQPEQVHVIATVHGCSAREVKTTADQVLAVEDGRAFADMSAEPIVGEVLFAPDPSDQDPATPGGDARKLRIVHFGYADGISQPRFIEVDDPSDYPDSLPLLPVGVVLLGHDTAFPHVKWNVPQGLGQDGAFNAFRVLEQDVPGFESFLDNVAAQHGAEGIDQELVAAKLCGRWRDGTPLTVAPTAADRSGVDRAQLNDFDYLDCDADGLRCPIGSHIRRTNPRGAHIVQRPANRTRSLIRRGIPYGKVWDPSDEASRNEPRGLLGNFICGSLAAQFEAIQYDWINLGFQDPRITGTNDPLVGTNDARYSSFRWPRVGQPDLVLRGLPRFVTTRGGAYTFLPSIEGIKWIACAGGAAGTAKG